MNEMDVIRKSMIRVLIDLGYSAKAYKMTEIMATIGSGRQLELSFEVKSVNPRRYEVCITTSHRDGFNPLLQPKPACGSASSWARSPEYAVAARFRKDSGIKGIMEALKWVAKAHTKHSHLDLLINPDAPLPAPRVFKSGDAPIVVYNTYWNGYITKCRVRGIAIASRRKLSIIDDYREDGNPMFLVEVALGGSYDNVSILTDGDVWYPVWEYKADEYIVNDDANVFYGHAEDLHNMNATDQRLIMHAIRGYGEKFLAE